MTETLLFNRTPIRVRRTAYDLQLSIDDIASIIPAARDVFACDVDDDDRLGDMVSLRGAVAISHFVADSATPGTTEYEFRRWLWGEVAAMYPVASGSTGVSTDRRIMTIIDRLGSTNLTQLTRYTQSMNSRDRRAAIQRLVASGMLVERETPVGAMGRPTVTYHRRRAPLDQPATAA